jgi:hypothetical protein
MSKTHDVFSYRFDQPPDNATVESGSARFSSFPRSLPLTHARAGRSLALPGGRVRVLEPAPDAEPAQHAAGLRRARELHDARVGELRAQPRPEPHRPSVSSACARASRG